MENLRRLKFDEDRKISFHKHIERAHCQSPPGTGGVEKDVSEG
jgi:hypothetical protein